MQLTLSGSPSDDVCVADLLAEIPEADFVALAGNGINQQLVSAKLRWIEKHELDGFLDGP